MKKFLEKFFDDAYFGKPLFEMDFLGEKFLKSSTFVFWLDFLGKNFFDRAFFWRSLFKTDFLGKKICNKLFALYRQKTPGTGRGGGSGGV